MNNEKTIYPLAGSVSAGGFGGVSPRVSILHDAIAGPAHALQQVMEAFTPVAAHQVGEALKSQIEDIAVSVDQVYTRTLGSAENFNGMLLEATRTNMEQAMRLLQDLGGAKNPMEMISIQTEYCERQYRLFAQQLADISKVFQNTFASMGHAAAKYSPAAS